MARQIPVAVRQLIVDACDRGDTQEEVAELYNVGTATVTRLLARRRKTGSLNPSPRPGRTPTLDDYADGRIREWIREQPDLTLKELGERLADIGYFLEKSALCDNLKRLMLPRKKKACTLPSGTGRKCRPGGKRGPER